MTVALCTNCGELKHGALCQCPNCKSPGAGIDINILLSDHHLTESELSNIGDVVRVICTTGLDEEMRFQLLVYFLSLKWPKLLEYDASEVEPKQQRKIDELYRSKLSSFRGQLTSDLKSSPVSQDMWGKAQSEAFSEEDFAWQSEVRPILMQGFGIAEKIIITKINSGEGAVLQRFTHFIRALFRTPNYRQMSMLSVELVGDAEEYGRLVDQFCNRVKNGWSGRTIEQAAYFRGLCLRLEEMAKYTKKITEHRAGISRLIAIDLERTRQELRKSYNIFIELSQVVRYPSRINPNGTCLR